MFPCSQKERAKPAPSPTPGTFQIPAFPAVLMYLTLRLSRESSEQPLTLDSKFPDCISLWSSPPHKGKGFIKCFYLTPLPLPIFRPKLHPVPFSSRASNSCQIRETFYGFSGGCPGSQRPSMCAFAERGWKGKQFSRSQSREEEERSHSG